MHSVHFDVNILVINFLKQYTQKENTHTNFGKYSQYFFRYILNINIWREICFPDFLNSEGYKLGTIIVENTPLILIDQTL